MSDSRITINSPLKGRAIGLSEVEDVCFSSGILGIGAAVIPEEGIVISPDNAAVLLVADTGHLIALRLSCGAEIMIHIGLDTVGLNGEGFRLYVKSGDRVKKGQKLAEFDIDLIKSKGLCLTSPVVISEMCCEQELCWAAGGSINYLDELFTVIQK